MVKSTLRNSLPCRQKGNSKIHEVGLYWTSHPIRESGKFSKSGLSGNRTFSFLDFGLLTLSKIEKRKSKFFQDFFLLFAFDTKFVSRDLILGDLITWYSHLSNKRDVKLTDFEKFHPTQIKNPTYTFIDFLDFSTLHSTFIRFIY